MYIITRVAMLRIFGFTDLKPTTIKVTFYTVVFSTMLFLGGTLLTITIKPSP